MIWWLRLTQHLMFLRKNMPFFFEIKNFQVDFSLNCSRNLTNWQSQNGFFEKRAKNVDREGPNRNFGESKFLIETLSKNIFEVGDPKNRRF